MRPAVLSLISTTLIGGIVAQQDAPETTGNPAGVVYRADLPAQPFFKDAALHGNVQGSVVAQSAPDGKGVKFSISFSNFPASGGPFLYHIHAQPATNGNCTSTLAHLDPFNVGEDHVCDPTKANQCQVGDLSGKYGKISKDSFSAEYTDPFLSTKMGSNAFFGDKSIVIHYANKTRLTCANFVRQGNATAVSTGATTPPAGSPGGSPTAPPPANRAASVATSPFVLVGGLVAVMALAL